MTRIMKDSGIEWLGKIPENWYIDKLNRIFHTITDFVASGSFADLAKNVKYLDTPDYAQLVRTTDISGKGYSSKPVYIDEASYNYLRNSNLYGGEIILPNIGGVGEVYIVPKLYEKMSLAPNSIMLRTNQINKFYYYYFASQPGRESLLSIAGSTAQPKFNKTSLKQIKLPKPSIDEQQKIADFLDEKCGAIDEIISKTEQSIEEYKKLKQSVITKAVTKGIRPNRPMQDSNIEWIGEIPTDWEIMKLKFVFEIKKDIAGKEGYTVLSITQTGIKPKNITSNEGQQASDYSKYQLVDKGDFAMNHMDLLTGWVDISKYDGVTSPDYRVFRLKKINNCDRYFLYMMQLCYLNKIFYGFGQGVSGFGRWRLPADMFLNFLIPIPPLDEQKEIADYLDEKCAEIDTLIEKKQQFLAEIANYKKSLIYEYVTGKKEVA